MKPFHTIAIPHDDILQGRLTLDVFAANLWEVYQWRGPEEYRDPDLFFQKTYLTDGLKNLFAVVEKRLRGQGGDPVIQMQTPFGGGKTHSLIALYHKAREWGVKTAVIVGTEHNAEQDTLWGLLAGQLTGSRAGFEGRSAPGSEALRRLLDAHQPLLILMDEVLEYAIKASAVPIGESTLATQTLAFMQELTEAVSSLERVALVVTLPSSTLEHYDERGMRLFEQLKKISGRVEKIFTPVKDEEVGAIIRRRLFSYVDEKAALEVINAYIEQAEQEALLLGEESAAYRARFKQTYPFLPEVVDVLYHRWGSFPNFQRTRGTLRLLALVVHALKNASRSYITLADFPLQQDDIRRELLNHIGSTYDSVLAADLLTPEAGARRANLDIGKAYQGLGLGERVATTIFLYSFVGGGGEAGATPNEIKRHTLTPGLPASVVAEVLSKLTSRLLFYLHEEGGRYYFSTTPNLNQALTIRMENVAAEDLRTAEWEALRERVRDQKMKPFIWPTQSANISDDPEPKLIILPEADTALMQRFLTEKGQAPRVHRNTLFFLVPAMAQRPTFENLLRRYLALRSLLSTKTLSLTPEQRQELQKQEKEAAKQVQEQIGMLYRLLYLPDRGELRELDLGTPAYGDLQYLEERVYERLRSENRLAEKLAPLVIKQRYLSRRDFIETQQLAESSSRTPGEMLVVGRHVWESCIAEGVRQGLFGLGELDEQGQPKCLYFKEGVTPALQNGEVIIRAEICEQQKASLQPAYKPVEAASTPATVADIAPGVFTPSASSASYPPPSIASRGTGPGTKRLHLRLRFTLSFGRFSELSGLFRLLQDRFKRLEITLEASEGAIGEDEIQDKVLETFRQIGVTVEID